MDFLMRDGAILNPEQWTELDAVVVKTAKTVLTGRKFLDIYGPLGAGTEAIATDALPTPTFLKIFMAKARMLPDSVHAKFSRFPFSIRTSRFRGANLNQPLRLAALFRSRALPRLPRSPRLRKIS